MKFLIVIMGMLATANGHTISEERFDELERTVLTLTRDLRTLWLLFNTTAIEIEDLKIRNNQCEANMIQINLRLSEVEQINKKFRDDQAVLETRTDVPGAVCVCSEKKQEAHEEWFDSYRKQVDRAVAASTIRLTNGTRSSEGRVEVFHQNTWGTICSDFFDEKAAMVVCELLGFHGSYFFPRRGAYYGQGSGQVWLDDVRCTGSETTLKECTTLPWGQHTCSHSNDIGVDCKSEWIQAPVRLEHGAGPWEGLLEVLYNDEWGTVSGDGFDSNDAAVVCGMLGYHRQGAMAMENAYFGEGSGRIWLDNLKCNRTETDIALCDHYGWGVHGCNHSKDVSVICQDKIPNVQVRIVGSNLTNQGLVEVKYHGQSAKVCGEGWSASEAAVICRAIGQPFYTASVVNPDLFDESTVSIWLGHASCNGNETHLEMCSLYGWGISSCPSQIGAAVICVNDTSNTPIRLSHGAGPWEGLLEVFFSGEWGTVCSDGFDLNDVAIVCQMLGYSTTDALSMSGAYFQPGNGRIWLNDLNCTGNETDIALCDHLGWGITQECDHSDDVSVICQNNMSNVQVRLVGSNLTNQGFVEVQYQGRWAKVCDDGWSASEASVICRTIGQPFSTATIVSPDVFNESTVPIWLGHASCNGTETQLEVCSLYGWGISFCPSQIGAAVICVNDTVHTPIRLSHGAGPWEGLLEVSFNGEWGTVCSDGFDVNDATVVCQMLGYSTQGALVMSGVHFQPQNGRIWLNDLNCTGNETDIALCDHLGWGITQDCDHSADVFVICQNKMSNVQVRLVGSNLTNQGFVEVQYQGRWAKVCDDGWSASEASVICRTIGQPFSTAAIVSADVFDESTVSIWLGHASCNGNERSIEMCSLYGWGITSCPSQIGAAVICVNDTANTPIRLSHGAGPWEGLLEVFLNGEWGTVCSDGFDLNDVAVVCQMLGYSPKDALSRSGAYFQAGNGRIWLDDLNCIGTETDIALCDHLGWGITQDCDHSEDVSVICPNKMSNVQVRLVGSNLANQGLVEVQYQGRWAKVCNDGLSASDASVVCKTIGQPFSEAYFVSPDIFGESSASTWLGHIACSGEETHLEMCSLYGWGSRSCQSRKGAAVRCTDDNINMKVRLSYGAGPWEGLLEVNHDGEWGTVCDDEFNATDAMVVCRMLGYSTEGAIAKGGSYFTEGSGRIWLDDLGCDGDEADIALCGHTGWGNHNCEHTEDVSVICLDVYNQISNVQVRLVGSSITNEGLVEVQYQGRWATVCGADRTGTQAAVVCRMIRQQFATAVTVDPAAYSHGAIQTWLGNVTCNGDETHLGMCSLYGWGRRECPEKALAVRCTNDKVNVRLSNGAGPWEGLLEVFFNGEWGTVCDDHFDSKDAAVVCRMLGYPSGRAVARTEAYFGQGSGRIWLDDLECNGNEADIVLCSHPGLGVEDCDHSEDVSVIC